MRDNGNSERAMHTLLRWFPSVLCFLPAAALAYLAFPHFLDGAALDAAIPVPNYMIAQIAMPKSAYAEAETALGRADPSDGEAQIERAEAALRAGATPGSQVPRLIRGVTLEPASARGWTLLAYAWAPADRVKAANALAMALELAPKDYWLAGMRSEAAAMLWPQLDPDAQASALAQMRLLWEEPLLRGRLRKLLTSKTGVALVTRAFSGQQDEVREMNRWLAVERRRHPIVPVAGGFRL